MMADTAAPLALDVTAVESENEVPLIQSEVPLTLDDPPVNTPAVARKPFRPQ